jgi:hypothetical protein
MGKADGLSLAVASFHGCGSTPSHLSHLRRSRIASARREEEPSRRTQRCNDPHRLPARASLPLSSRFGARGATTAIGRTEPLHLPLSDSPKPRRCYRRGSCYTSRCISACSTGRNPLDCVEKLMGVGSHWPPHIAMLTRPCVARERSFLMTEGTHASLFVAP